MTLLPLVRRHLRDTRWSLASSVAWRSAATPPAASCVGAGAATMMRFWSTTSRPFSNTACNSRRPWLDWPSSVNTCSNCASDTCNCGVCNVTRSPSTAPWRDRRSVMRWRTSSAGDAAQR